MQLPYPPGFVPVWGTNPSSYTSADGALFYSAFGKYNNVSGQYVIRVVNGVAAVVPLPITTSARGILSLDHDGLYLTSWMDGGTALHRQQVPGYKLFAGAGAGAVDPRVKGFLDGLTAALRALIS
jgi:hypothetical protein